MKHYLFILIISIGALTSCNSKTSIEKVRQQKIFTFSKSELKAFDSTAVLDSIRKISLDTITDNDLYFMRINRLEDTVSNSLAIIRNKQEQINSYLQLVRLSAGLSSAIQSTYKEDALKLIAEVKEELKKDSMYRVRLDELALKHKNSDTTTLRYIEVKSLRQYHRSDLSVKRDTVYIVFDRMENLIRLEDIK